MAERYRTATGNWSNAAQWDGGVALPGAGDDCYANNFTVTVNQDVTVSSLRTTAGATAVAGGIFNATTQTINADVIAGTSSCLAMTGMGVLNGDSFGGSANQARGAVLAQGAVHNGNSLGGSHSTGYGTDLQAGAVQNGNSTGSAVTRGTFIQNGGVQIGDATGGSAANVYGTLSQTGGIFRGRCFGGSNATAYGVRVFAGGVAVVNQITDSTAPGCRLENGGVVILWGSATAAQVNNGASVGQYVLQRGTASKYPFIRPPVHPSFAC